MIFFSDGIMYAFNCLYVYLCIVWFLHAGR